MTSTPARMTRANAKDAQLEQMYALTGVLARLEGRLTEAISGLRGLVVNGVLFSGAVKLDATGQYTADFTVPFGAVAVGNNDTAKVTLHNSSGGASAPTQGVGVHTIAAGKSAIFPLAGRELTLYGTPGAIVMLGVYDRPQTAATFAPDAAGSLTANDADAQGNFAGASAVDAHSYGYNGASWDRMRTTGDNADAIAVSALGELLALVRNTGFNGSAWDRLRTIAAQGDGLGVLGAMQPSAAYVTANATNATATATFAGVAGQRHRLVFATAMYQNAPVSATGVTVADGGTTIATGLGAQTPYQLPLPPGGLLASAVNQSVTVSIGAGGVGVVGIATLAKLTA